jgi:hypothetical protein
VAAIYERLQVMGDSVYLMPESSDIAMALIRQNVLDISRQNGKEVQGIKLPKLTAFPAFKESLGYMKEKLVSLEALQDPEDSE